PTEFEVVEIRPAKVLPDNPAAPNNGALGNVSFRSGRLEVMGATLKALVTLAFDIKEDRLSGAPKWWDEDKFDVIAKTSPMVPFEVVGGMLKTALIARFKLVTHEESQAKPVFVLSTGKKPHLKESDGTERSGCKIVF